MGMQDKLIAPLDFDGPIKDRKCTDIIFMGLIVCLWIAMTVIGISSIREGDVDKLLAPLDYNGSLCGWDSHVEDMPNLYYVNTQGSGVCIESCPTETTSDLICRYDVDESLSDAEKVSTGFCRPTLESTEVVNYCIYSNATAWEDVQQSDLSNYLTQFISDIITARGYVFGFGIGVALLIGFLYIGLLQIPFLVAVLVWSCVLLVLVSLLAIGFGAWATAEDWNEAGTKSDVIVNAAYGGAVVAWVLAFLWVCLFCFLAKRISLAIGIIKEAGRSVAGMPLMVLFPAIQLVGFIAFIAIWMVYAAYTASLGDIEVVTVESVGGYDLSYKVYHFEQDVENRGWFLIFCFYWTVNFITAIGQIVIAMSVASWYFARDKSKIGSCTVVTSTIKSFTFHLGTAAFGGLIIAIIEFIQAVLSYIEKKAKQSNNKVVEWIACCCMCFFWCLENCMRYINKNAYVQTAIFSTNFCMSAANAFYLIARNIARVAAVGLLGEFVLSIMTAFITVVTAVLAYYAMDANIRDDLHSIVGPTIMTAVLAYFTGKMITSVFGMSITTILQCFIADEEMYPPSQQYADNDIRQWVDRHGAPTVAHTSPNREHSAAQQHSWS